MSIVLERCTECDGKGFLKREMPDVRFHVGVESCWSCGGTGEVARMLTVTQLADEILARRDSA